MPKADGGICAHVRRRARCPASAHGFLMVFDDEIAHCENKRARPTIADRQSDARHQPVEHRKSRYGRTECSAACAAWRPCNVYEEGRSLSPGQFFEVFPNRRSEHLPPAAARQNRRLRRRHRGTTIAPISCSRLLTSKGGPAPRRSRAAAADMKMAIQHRITSWPR